MSLKEKITRNKRQSARFAAGNAVVAGTALGLGLAHAVPLWLWLPIAVIQSLAIIGNTHKAVRLQQALDIYNSNPAAAYIAEVKHTFGGM